MFRHRVIASNDLESGIDLSLGVSTGSNCSFLDQFGLISPSIVKNSLNSKYGVNRDNLSKWERDLSYFYVQIASLYSE